MKPVLIVQNVAVESPGRIIDYLQDRGLSHTVVHSYKGQELPDIDSIDGLIALGTPNSMLDYQSHDHLKNLYAYMSAAVRVNMPVLGLCFGGQMLAHVLGARVEAMKSKEIGVHEVAVTDAGAEDPLFEGIPRDFPAIHWHGDAFRIPFGTPTLASTPHCKTQAFRSNRQVGLQFHLEVRADDLPAWFDAYPEEVSEVGIDTEQMSATARDADDSMREVSYQLLDNFFKL